MTSAAFFSYLASSINFSCLPARRWRMQQKAKMATASKSTPQTTPMMMYFVVGVRPFHFCFTVCVVELEFSPSSLMGEVSLLGSQYTYSSSMA